VEIIPVIDVMGGKLVHARGGKRADYLPLTSLLTECDAPIEVIKDLLAYHPFSTFYIADLDAIMSNQRDGDLYSDLSNIFPNTVFYLDAGISDMESWQALAIYPNIYPVIGSETLLDILWLSDLAVRTKSILSLDFQYGKFLGDVLLLSSPNLWPERVIAMNLDCVGSQRGPDLHLLADLKTMSTSSIIAAGGVRNEQDLMELQQRGTEQVLIASALHDGRINKRFLETI